MVLPLIQLILTYGGVNVFVVVFILVAIAVPCLMDLNIPWWMYSCSCLGSSTVTIGMLPGSPQIQNIIPMQYFGTTTMAAPVLGILSSIITFAIGSLYIWWQCKRTNNKGEGFYPTGDLIDKEQLVEASVENEKPLWQCLLPMIVVIVVLNVLKQSAVIALCSGCVVAWLLYDPRKQDLKKIFSGAMPQAIMPLITVCCASGFGGVVAAVPGFQTIVGSLNNFGTSPFMIVLVVNICSGICGSASSGENIALQNFADRFHRNRYSWTSVTPTGCNVFHRSGYTATQCRYHHYVVYNQADPQTGLHKQLYPVSGTADHYGMLRSCYDLRRFLSVSAG